MSSRRSFTRVGRTVEVLALLAGTCSCVVIHQAQPASPTTVLETDVELVRRATQEVRAIGTAIEAYSVDFNRYPLPEGPGDRIVGDFELHRLRGLRETLRLYSRVLPNDDPWESPYLVWSDGQHYAVLCLGSDGAVSKPGRLAKLLAAVSERTEEPWPQHCLEDEIVFANGQGIWWPRDPVRRCSSGADSTSRFSIGPLGSEDGTGGRRGGARSCTVAE